MKKVITFSLFFLYAVCGISQSSWTLSMTGFDLSFSPADFAKNSSDEIFVNGVKYDSGIGGFVNKLFKSSDAGATWSELTTTGLTNLGNVHTLTSSGSTLILGGMDVVASKGAKIFTSTDNGASWNLSMTGFDDTYAPADFVTTASGDIYLNGVKYDSGKGGYINKLYKSSNKGALWTEVITTGLTSLGNVHSITKSGSVMILAGMDLVSTNGAKIYTSFDNGSTWTLSMVGYDIAYAPADFVTTTTGDVYLNGVKHDSGIGGLVNKLYKSSDKGGTWNEITSTGLTNLGNVHTIIQSGSNLILGGMDVVSTKGAKIYISNIALSIEEGTEAFLNTPNVFPNPFKDIITINLNSKFNETIELKLMSITGEVIKIVKTNSNLPLQLNVENLPKSLYLLSVKNSSRTQWYKITNL